MTNTIQDTSYNGWTNYETWNVSLWIQNNEWLYNLALELKDYSRFVSAIGFGEQTPDGVGYASTKLNYAELNEMMQDL